MSLNEIFIVFEFFSQNYIHIFGLDLFQVSYFYILPPPW